MDISDTIKANSEQVNADDLLSGPVTARIVRVERGTAEQPLFIHTDAFEGRTYRPSKSMRRVLVLAWSSEASSWVGRSLTLFRNPDISFGREKVGGIQVSHMSHIEKPLTVALTVSRGKRAPYTVQPLAADPADEWIAAFNEAATVAQLQAAWEGATKTGVTTDPRVVAAKDKRKGELT